MSELLLEPEKVYEEDPLGILDNQEESLIVAFETVHVIYSGLITTPYRDYQKDHIQSALRARVTELSEITNYSAESIYLAIDNITTGTYSTENDFFTVVKSVIEKIVEWLTNVKDWIVNIAKRLFSVRNQAKASSKATSTSYKQSQKKYEQEKRDFPERIKVSIPGQCYLAFHTPRHTPQTSYVYNTAGLEKAITGVNDAMNKYMTAFEKDADRYLAAVEQLVTEITNAKMSVGDGALIRLNKTRELRGLYHDKFQVIGFGFIDKPVRNQTRYFQTKIAITNLVDSYGWNSVDSFDVTIETNRFEELNDTIGKNTDVMLGRIIALTNQLSNSNAIKRLGQLRKEQGILVKLAEVSEGESSSVAIARQKDILDRINLTYELVNQLTDMAMLTSRFYSRYTVMLTRLMANIAAGIAGK